MNGNAGVGVVIESPIDLTHAYRVRLMDGSEVSRTRGEFAVLAQYQTDQAGYADRLAEHDLYEHVIYRCVVGSRAFGLDDEGSDFDRRGIYLPPAERQWSLAGVPEQLENPETEEVYWELQKFLTLALKANPNVLECLYTPLIEHATPLAQELIAMRQCFLSKLAYHTFNGYVMSQFKKLRDDFRKHGEPKWKHVMHLLRLLNSGVTVLRDGVVTVRVYGATRDKLLAIKRGVMPMSDIDTWREQLQRELDEAYKTTTLPDRPDYAAAGAFLLQARRGMVK